MSTPQRIQLSRRKGWRMPPNTVKVSRPGKWGNRFKVGQSLLDDEGNGIESLSREQAVELFRLNYTGTPELDAYIRAELRGKNLACWCPLEDADGSPVMCHADVLLRLANAEATS